MAIMAENYGSNPDGAAAPVAIALGSNLGDRSRFLEMAVDQMRGFVLDLRVSPTMESEPMYLEDQPRFLNAIAVGFCQLGPFALLRQLKAIERKLGRQAGTRYGPREIDLDVIVYGSLILSSPGVLTVPHARLHERRFVLEPLAEFEPNLQIPGQKTVIEALRALL